MPAAQSASARKAGRVPLPLELVPRRQRADDELAVPLLDPVEVETADVDDDRWPCDAELHRREERLAAGEELRVGRSESVERLLDGSRTNVVDGRGDHAPPAAARTESTIES